jgi:hypothetical protein
MRPLDELDQLPVSEWTREEALAHVRWSFDNAARAFPDVMEPYAILLVDAEQDDEAQMKIMQGALRDTFKNRKMRGGNNAQMARGRTGSGETDVEGTARR